MTWLRVLGGAPVASCVAQPVKKVRQHDLPSLEKGWGCVYWVVVGVGGWGWGEVPPQFTFLKCIKLSPIQRWT